MLKKFFNEIKSILSKIFKGISKFTEENRISGIIIALVFFIFIFAFSLSGTYERFELGLYDIRFKVKPSIKEWDRLTFIDIDENSLTTLGNFPWPRRLYATGLKSLKKINSSLVSFDVMFFDESPDHVNHNALKSITGKGSINTKDIYSIILENDKIFSESVSHMGKVILSYTFNNQPLTEEAQKRQNTRFFRKARKRFLNLASIPVPPKEAEKYKSLEEESSVTLSLPIPRLMNSAHSFGFVNRYTDIDGVLRRVRLVRFFDNRLFFNLAVVMLMDACSVSKENVVVIPGDRIILKQALNPKTWQIEDITIPIDEKGMVFVNWVKGKREKTFNALPFYSLIDYSIYQEDVNRFFENIDSQGGFDEMKGLQEELNKALKTKRTAENWKKIVALRKKLTKKKTEYSTVIKDDIAAVKEDIKKSDDPGFQKELAVLQDNLKAIELVIKLENDLPEKIIITGLTATGTHDIGIMPLEKEYARVGTYHNTINTVIQKSFIKKAGILINGLLMLIVSLIMGFTIQRLSARMSVLTIGASIVVVNIIIIGLFAFFNFWIDQLGISLALILPATTIAAMKLMKEESQKRFIKNAFSRYLAPGVIEDIIKNPESLELGGESRIITTFFSDVAGFSTISEKLTPSALVSLLNEYLSEMTEIILQHGGTIDKYEGDAIMAFYGAPQPIPDHALKACMAAIDMEKRLKELQDKWREEGKDALFVRMGMNTGEAVVGNMGSKTRMDYTAMGDSVNLASRLEGANKHYKTYSMISETTYRDVEQYVDARKLDIIRVVGKDEPITVYELLGKKGTLSEEMYEMIEIYYKGLELFNNREWKKALSQFNAALKIISDDGPCMVYMERCREYSKKPPSKNWDGVYKMKSK
ncbi:MAG: adenylate/guanylate cyclase domain-containing protein [bacterium]|nr:adenylate/guanylate cyclase domain-containing protein [bacterium]